MAFLPDQMIQGKLNILLGGMLGSEGKGLVASYIGWHNHVDLAISNASPNAGHTFYFGKNKYVTRHLPISGILNRRSTIYLCAGSIIDPEVLHDEMEQYDIDPARLVVHPRAAVIEDIDRTKEQISMKSIASTQKGVGSALIRKIERKASLAQDHHYLSTFVKEIDVHYYLEQGVSALMEVPQGFDLSLNAGLSYPYCTSRDITVSQAMSDAQVHPSLLGHVYVCIRTFPIRVGNVEEDGRQVGYSGPFPDDSVELSWDDVGVAPEYTTNTNRVRRVCTFSFDRYEHMVAQMRPDYIFLNFVNYLSEQAEQVMLDRLPGVTHVCRGPRVEDVEQIKPAQPYHPS